MKNIPKMREKLPKCQQKKMNTWLGEHGTRRPAVKSGRICTQTFAGSVQKSSVYFCKNYSPFLYWLASRDLVAPGRKSLAKVTFN